MKALDKQEFIFPALCWQRVETGGLRSKVPFMLGAWSDILKTGSCTLLIVTHGFLYLQLPPFWLQVEWSAVRTSQLRPLFGHPANKEHNPWKVLNLDKGHSGSRQDRGLVTPGGLRPSSCSLLACTVLVLSQGTAHLQQCAKPCCDPLPGDF